MSMSATHPSRGPFSTITPTIGIFNRRWDHDDHLRWRDYREGHGYWRGGVLGHFLIANHFGRSQNPFWLMANHLADWEPALKIDGGTLTGFPPLVLFGRRLVFCGETSMKIRTLVFGALVGAGTLAALAAPASAYVACNGRGDCWHVNNHYGYRPAWGRAHP